MSGAGGRLESDQAADARLLVHSTQPFNAGPPLQVLGESFITPRELFFVRNHGTVPDLQVDGYRLRLSGLVERPLTLSLGRLRDGFDKHTVVAALECAGNRRRELMAVLPIEGELAWGPEAIGNAEWGGVRLRDLLADAGAKSRGAHVAFAGLDEVAAEGRPIHYGASISVEKAMSAETLLAYEMNGEPLSGDHGFPLRAVVPGYVGARSVKWLGEIVVREAPSDNYFQAHAYKTFPAHVRAADANWSEGLTLDDLPVNAVICRPRDGETLEPGEVAVAGYAVTGGEARIETVEVSGDSGQSWTEAGLRKDSGRFAWRLWQTRLRLAAGRHRIVVRARDSKGNCQSPDPREVWNFKGYVNNAWHRIEVLIRES